MKSKKKIIILSIILIIFASFFMLGVEYYTSQPKFCSSCHIMKKAYTTWQDSKHREVACVKCHYAPGESHTINAKLQGLSRVFSYLSASEKEVREKAFVNDLSCTQSDCHPLNSFNEKKIQYTEKVSFVHKIHNEKRIEGQVVHCNTCHIHTSADKHLEVPKKICFLCHFKNSEFNKKRGKCLSCHTLPEEPIQEHGDKPITHKKIQDAKVPCSGCHLDIISGDGSTSEERCLYCHDRSEELLKKSSDKKLMHEKHIATQKANCFHCHEPIIHKKTTFYGTILENCSSCHPDHHKFQKILLLGGTSDKNVPNPMFTSRTNCMGCHTKKKDIKGEKLFIGTASACVACHAEGHEKMLQDWINELEKELNDAIELEVEAEKLLANSTGQVSDEVMTRVRQMFDIGRKNLQIVRFGNGVHNKKYAMMLIDKSFNNFEDLIDLLNEERNKKN